MDFTKKDYTEAIRFALNFPDDYRLVKYDMYKDIYIVEVMDGGWWTVRLEGKFVRSCLNFKGVKRWNKDTPKN